MVSESLLFLFCVALAASTAHAGSLRGLKTVGYALPDTLAFEAVTYECLNEDILCSGFEHFLQGEEKMESFQCAGGTTGTEYTFHTSDKPTVSKEEMEPPVTADFMLSTRNPYSNQRSDVVGRLEFFFHKDGEDGKIVVSGLNCVGN